MNRSKIHHLRRWFALFVAVISIGVTTAFSDNLSAASQLFLYVVLVIVVGGAGLLACYQTPGLSEVLAISRPGKRAKVVRGGAFILPLTSQTIRVRLTPMWVEFPKNGNAGLTRENRLITKDGLPVTAFARIEVRVGSDDDSILKFVDDFSGSSDHEIREHFEKILSGAIARVVAETEYSNLTTKHDEFHMKVLKVARFEAVGYQITRVDPGRVTQLKIEEAGLHGVDECRAKAIVALMESDERINEIDREQKENKARAEAREDEVKSEAAYKKLQQEAEQAIAIRRIANEQAVQIQELKRDIEVLGQRALKRDQEAKTEKEEQKRRLDLEETANAGRIRAARAECEARSIVLESAVNQQKEALKLRGEELQQNKERVEGDLDYQLKKEAIQQSANVAREQTSILSAALGKSNLNFVGDPAAAAELARDYAKSFAPASWVKDFLSVFDNVHVHDAFRNLRDAMRSDADASKPFTTSAAYRSNSDNPRQVTDRDFAP
jgi:uncharacterized membrane protein YqiK